MLQFETTGHLQVRACSARRGPRLRSTEGKTPQKTPESSAPRPYVGYISSQWHTRQPQAPEQLAAISWCRSHAYRTTERAVSMPRSTEGKPPQKTPESSAPRPYIGYVSSQWHTRQPQALEQLAAISWCRSHAYRTTERAVSMPRSMEGKTPPINARIECSAAVHGICK